MLQRKNYYREFHEGFEAICKQFLSDSKAGKLRKIRPTSLIQSPLPVSFPE